MGKSGSSPREEIQKRYYSIFFSIFFYILFLTLASDILWSIINFTWDPIKNTIALEKIGLLNFERLLIYIRNFNPYYKSMYVMVFGLCILIFYFVIGLFVSKGIFWREESIEDENKNEEIALMRRVIYIMIFFASSVLLLSKVSILLKFSALGLFVGVIYVVAFCAFLKAETERLSSDVENKEIPYFIKNKKNYLSTLSIILITIFFFLFFRKYIDNTYKLFLMALFLFIILFYWYVKLVEKILNWKETKKSLFSYIVYHRWSIVVILCLLPGYVFFCLVFTGEEFLHLLKLLGFAVLFPVGLSLCGFTVRRALDKNKEILDSIGSEESEKASEESEKASEESERGLVQELRRCTNSLLINLLAAISSYIFLTAILQEWREGMSLYLSILLYIPLYVFFYEASLVALRSIYRKLYVWIERYSGLTPDPHRRDSFVSLFYRLSRLIILSVTVLILLDTVELLDTLRKIVSDLRPILEIVIGIPLGLWILAVVLDPFFEGEIIEVGSRKGRIVRVGPFFTKLETITGEKIYIPNAELMIRTIKRFNKRGEEEWMITHFSCTLDYKYELKKIEKIFKDLFVEENDDSLRNYLKEMGFEKASKEVDSHFSTEATPFVSIEDFKEHGVTYRFNFRLRDAFYAPIFKSYFMKRFSEEMKRKKMEIMTPLLRKMIR